MAVVEQTDLITYTTARAASFFTATHKLEVHPLPVRVRAMPLIMVWHESFDGDGGHRWLRQTIRDICKSI